MSAIRLVLLAAGNAQRYGRAKLLEDFAGAPLIRRLATAALDSGCRLRVVTGAYADRIETALAGLDAEILHNPDWAEGMGGSIATAFRPLPTDDGTDTAAIVCPADLPLIGAAQLHRLIEAHRARPQRIVVSDWGAAQGAPCLFPSHYFAELAQLQGPQGARPLLSRHAAEIDAVAMPEAAFDIDTPEDYARLVARHATPQDLTRREP